jgi:fatty-acyl-CoA synthase
MTLWPTYDRPADLQAIEAVPLDARPLPTSTYDALRRHPAVLDAGVVGRPDQHSGEVPVAFVAVRDGPVDGDQIRRWAADHVPERAAAPKAVTVLPALPVTAVGKPYKLGLRILATRHELAGRLAALGYRVPDDDWCDQQDGQIVVALPPPPEPTLRAAVRDLLDRYPLTWRFT